MKTYVFFINLAFLNIGCFAMSPKGNPGCIRQNSGGIRAAMFLIYLESGRLALDLLDTETYENVGKKPLNDALINAQKKYSLDIKPALKYVEFFKKEKTGKDVPPSSDLPD